MKTLFATGIQSPRNLFWMGQQTAFVNTTPTETTAKETSWTDVLAQAITSGATAYGSYGDVQEAEAAAEAKEAEAAAKEAAARTAQIMQQTNLLQQQAAAKQDQIMGIDKTAFFMGATLLGLLAVGGTLFLLSRD